MENLLVFGLVSLLVRGFYIFLFPNCYSYDVRAWNMVANMMMAGENPYSTGLMNWPPLWMQLLFLFKKISLAWPVSFNCELRIFLIAVETLMAMLLYVVLVRFVPAARARRVLLAGIALNPISVLQVCLQCHFDVLVGFWILLAVYLLLRFHEEADSVYWLAACLALGVGAATKTIPLCLVPLLASSARSLKRLELGLGATLVLLPITLSTSVIYVLDPQDVAKHVLGYRSIVGVFGFTGLFNLLGLNWLVQAWPIIFEVVYGTGWAVLGLGLWRGGKLEPVELVVCASTLLLAIPAMGPGYGANYIYWFIPLLLLLYVLSRRGVRIFLLAGYAVATVVYLISYGFNFTILGGFVLDIVQTRELLDFGQSIHTKIGQTLVGLPLWLFYLAFVGYFGLRMGRKIKAALLNPRANDQ